MADEYLDLLVEYSTYTPEIWHEDTAGGYWGEGAAKVGISMNGAIRATNSIMLGYALLVRSIDEGWLTDDQNDWLLSAELNRESLLNYIKANLEHITAHHYSAPAPVNPTWGDHWQSSLWIGTASVACMLVWNDLSFEEQEAMKRITRPEADRIAAKPPKDHHPGDTGAEENGWDTQVLAAAIVMNPGNPNIDKWWRTIRVYAMNTYSHNSDKSNDNLVGVDKIRDLVTTENILDDYTMDNHNFFHPGYLRVSGQELGESWLILAMGDALFGSDWAPKFEPYALHNAEPVWRNVLRWLLTPDGEFVFPNGQDWTLHTSMGQAYLAWAATSFNDPLALLAEKRMIGAAQRRRELSPPGRIFGISNLEWWWEPLLIKRNAMAMLIHMMRPAPKITDKTVKELENGSWTRLLPEAKVWICRNSNYLVTASWGRIAVGTIAPTGPGYLENPYMTLPLTDGILPEGVVSAKELGEAGNAKVLVLGMEDGRKFVLVCLPNSCVWLSPAPFRAIGIQNDKMTGKGRNVYSENGPEFVPALQTHDTLDITSPWININNRFGMISQAGTYKYVPAEKLNRRSAAFDRITPAGSWGVWQMIPAVDSDETGMILNAFKASFDGKIVTTKVQDGSGGRIYEIRVDIGEKINHQNLVKNVVVIGKNISAEHPISNINDGNKDTFAVIRNENDTGPTKEQPVILEFDADTRDFHDPRLTISPRPNYGPRNFLLSVLIRDEWSICRRDIMDSNPVTIKVPDGEKWRLRIEGSYDRLNRNVQIAELTLTDGAPKEAPGYPAPLTSVTIK